MVVTIFCVGRITYPPHNKHTNRTVNSETAGYMPTVFVRQDFVYLAYTGRIPGNHLSRTIDLFKRDVDG